jgi:hypothetical protein
MLPGWVIWTAQETKGEDEQKAKVYGPDLIGKKATGKCGPWFGNFIHLDHMLTTIQADDPIEPNKKISVVEPRPFMFLKPHIDPTDASKMVWPAKTRAPMSLWHKVPPYMQPRFDKFLEFMDGLRAEARKLAQTEVKDVNKEATTNAAR